MSNATEPLGFDFYGTPEYAPMSHAATREIVSLFIGDDRQICADIRVSPLGPVDVTIEGPSSLTYAAAKTLVIHALEHGGGQWGTGRAWAERLSRRMRAGEVWIRR